MTRGEAERQAFLQRAKRRAEGRATAYDDYIDRPLTDWERKLVEGVRAAKVEDAKAPSYGSADWNTLVLMLSGG
jgi:hypothetical protein